MDDRAATIGIYPRRKKPFLLISSSATNPFEVAMPLKSLLARGKEHNTFA
jgi:hypothetical protein